MDDTSSAWTLRLSNSTSADLMVWLEPWAQEYQVRSRGEIAFLIETDSDFVAAAPELEFNNEGLVIYGAGNTRINVEIDGADQEAFSGKMAAPDTGPLSTRGFVGILFDNHPGARPGGKLPPKRNWFQRLFRT